MNFRVIAGTILSYTYNEWVSHIPLHCVRRIFLRCTLSNFGKETSVLLRCRFMNPRRISFGNRNVINSGCLLDGRKFEIRIGDDVSIGPEATVLTLGHDPQSPDFADRGGSVLIGDRVWIGYRTLILPGVTIGEGAVVGAGAVVTKDVEPFAIVVGNPARKIGERTRNITYQLKYQPWLQ